MIIFIFSNCQKEDENQSIIYGTVTDIDSNTYKTVTIGSQTWMAENLRVMRYNNGEAIPNEKGDWTWVCLTCGVYCNYDNKPETDSIYGKLYNWSAVSDSFHHLCPTSWHVPSDAEWATLTHYLTDSVSGGKLKEAETTHWNTPNTGATNESGFTALPGGFMDEDCIFHQLAVSGYWWTSTKPALSSGGGTGGGGTGGPPDPPPPTGACLDEGFRSMGYIKR